MRAIVILLFMLKFICGDQSNETFNSNPTPVVLWHGMGDTCCNVFSLGNFKTFLERKIPNVYVTSLRFGNSSFQDFENGYLLSPNIQVEMACNIINSDEKLKNGFNAIGFSQGSQFFRGLIQRCGHRMPRVKVLLSIGGQHQGVYGLPNCGMESSVCDSISEMLNYAAYNSWVQKTIVQATYWHDPLNEAAYRKKSMFLADINNERIINKTYIENLNKLEKFVMIKFNNDTIVQPRESEWFGFYAPGQIEKIIDLRDSMLYIKDRLGLRKMDKAGKLVFLSVEGNHLRFSEEWFEENIINPFLK